MCAKKSGSCPRTWWRQQAEKYSHMEAIDWEYMDLVICSTSMVMPLLRFRLGSDIDTLVITPKYVQREDFFEYLPKIINRMAPKDAIQEMTPVPDAFVPIIKLQFSGISIDLIYSHLNVTSVPVNFALKDPLLLRGLDDRGLRSVNGTRVTDEILELVPQKTTFRTALRGIKLWAQRKHIVPF